MELNSQFLLEGGDATPDSHLQRIMNGLHLHSDSWECQGNIHWHDIEANRQSWIHNQAILMAARAARSIAQSSSCWWVSLNPQVRNSTVREVYVRARSLLRNEGGQLLWTLAPCRAHVPIRWAGIPRPELQNYQAALQSPQLRPRINLLSLLLWIHLRTNGGTKNDNNSESGAPKKNIKNIHK
jgi:hypothetical protein